MKLVKSIFVLSSVLVLAIMATNSVFSDSAKVNNNQFSTGEWYTPPNVVINEVHYDLLGCGTEPNDEWVELYNSESSPVSLKNWTISDNGAVDTINANKSIPTNGFALLSKDHSTWSLCWSVPGGVEIVELGGVIGNGLSNTGDHLILKDNYGNVIDQLSWGTDSSVIPHAANVSAGHSLERDPKGTGIFIDQYIPTPGTGL